ncbi:zinc finger, CCHC-type, retrotransposon gag domain protein [Tanacetum coccineum]|uniref:Zinc finger, CCHC-type, retrotransposon gag domain protein n=1 Tax=Tanacetum coccineum TaxID=301880 RepID=A0ABQ4WSK9_9ASTR
MPPRRSNRVNNEADPAFTAAVAQAVADLLPTLTARITDEIRQNKNNGNNDNRRNSRRGNPEGTGNDGDAQPINIHVWLERFRKEKPQTFSSVSTPVEAENWIAHIEKIFEVLGCDDQFKARLATYKLEGDAHSWWRAYKQSKGGDAYVATLSWNDFRNIFFLQYFPYSEKEKCEQEYKSIRQLLEETSTDFIKRFLRLAAQVDNDARNIEIFHDRPKNKEDNKRDRDGHRIRPSGTPSQGSNPRADDRRDSDRYGSRGKHGNRERYNTDRWCGDRQGSDRHDNGSDRQGNGKACHGATGACFECGKVGHLANDCKKDVAFTAAVAQAVADLLPTLTARITNEIRQNKNNENYDNQRNSRRGNPEGTGNDGMPTLYIHSLVG